jgi:hypothetical protein
MIKLAMFTLETGINRPKLVLRLLLNDPKALAQFD